MYPDKEERKQNMLAVIFKVYVSRGLENTSMRNVAGELRINISSLYDYFKSKEEMVIECAKFYMEQLKDKFSEEFAYIAPDLKTEVKNVFNILVNEKRNLRFIYQVISSPMYGERGRAELERIYLEYMKYSDRLAAAYGIDPERFEEAFLLFIATVHDFCLWDNEDFVNKKLKCIYYLIDKELSLNE